MFAARLDLIRRVAWERASRRWWLWLALVIGAELSRDRLFSWANSAVDVLGLPEIMADLFAPVAFPLLVLAIAFGLVILFAYRDTKNLGAASGPSGARPAAHSPASPDPAIHRALDTVVTWLYRRQNWKTISPDARASEAAPWDIWASEKYDQLGLRGLPYTNPTAVAGEPGFSPPPDDPPEVRLTNKPPSPIPDSPSPESPYSGEWATSTEPPPGWKDNHWRGAPLRACPHCGFLSISKDRINEHPWTYHVTPPTDRLGGTIFEERQPWTPQSLHYLGPVDGAPRAFKGRVTVGPTYWATRKRADIAVQTGRWDYGPGPDDQSNSAAISSQVQT